MPLWNPYAVEAAIAVHNVLDIGTIVMWSGTIANIPAGWHICDGTGGTPNLLASFVEGVATAATDPGATGGAATHVLSAAEMPAHTHGGVAHHTAPDQHCVGPQAGTDATYGLCNNTVSTTGSTGSGSAHQNKPPFYDVAFIMKLS